MIHIRTSLLILIISFLGCTKSKNPQSVEAWKKEILDTEKAFAELAHTDGIQVAFMTFAADEAVLKRNEELIKGKLEIEGWFAKSKADSSVKLSWAPDFVDVSASGDLGYTFGNFKVQSTDSLGNVQESHGIFHTVWKRQLDGSWKYVWD